MAEGDWNAIVQEWIVDTEYAYAGAIASVDDCAFYAAAPVANDEGWGHVFAEPHEQQIMQEDGSTKAEMITETETLKTAIATGRCAKGLWIGKNKYSCVQFDKEFESGDATFLTLFANRPKAGAHIVSTGTTICVALYDESKGQTSGNCKRVVLAFAEYMKGIGY